MICLKNISCDGERRNEYSEEKEMWTRMHARMHNLVVRKELMMQKTEDEKKFLRICQEWEHKWKDLPLIIAGKEVGAEVVP